MITRQDLASAGVRFSSNPHGYTRLSDGKPLQGVTTMIQQLLYPDEYAHVDLDVLNAKAAWGTARHREIQDMIVFGDTPQTDAQRHFAMLMEQGGLEPIASEYTVTDGEDFASNIDVVCGDCTLIDIKTVATLNRAKVSWQLSLYAHFFELTNPGVKAGRLMVAWLPKNGNPRLVEVPRRPMEQLRELMQAWLNNTPYNHDCALRRDLIDEIGSLKYTIESLSQRYEALQAQLLDEMMAKSELSYQDDMVHISVRPASERSRLNTRALREAAPELYEQYTTVSAVAPSLVVRLQTPVTA